MAKTIDIEKSTEEELAKAALKKADLLAEIVDATAGDKRRLRTKAASVLELISFKKPELLVDYTETICDATLRPEAKTRCAIFETLNNLTEVAPEKLGAALEGAEASLFDEVSGPARLMAFVFFTRYGATAPERSDEVWTYIDEALQCYHGDSEFDDMMEATLRFATGNISDAVKQGLKDRVSFDAKNASGQLGRRANDILEALK